MEELEKQIKEDFKRKDWTINQWLESPDELDRLIGLISSYSPWNLWKAREAIQSYLSSRDKRLIEKLKERIKMRRGQADKLWGNDDNLGGNYLEMRADGMNEVLQDFLIQASGEEKE